ncbi:MAG: hypothetical protein ABGY71_12335 [bacterium]|jgi:hypothetical protein|nr:hypothetical protein [Planctomycetota bacterium]HIL52393.1 hypothetical protein [Planctomycetota bacterium]
MAKFKRRKKLIKPRLQLQLSLTFVGLTTIGLVMQSLLFMEKLSELSFTLPNDGSLLMSVMSETMTEIFLLSALVFLPLTLVVGILLTFRIAGPAYRMETYLRDIKEGKYKGPCRIREGDKLEELCCVMNEAIESLVAQLPEEKREALSSPSIQSERKAA